MQPLVSGSPLFAIIKSPLLSMGISNFSSGKSNTKNYSISQKNQAGNWFNFRLAELARSYIAQLRTETPLEVLEVSRLSASSV